MVAIVATAAYLGLEARAVEVQVQVAAGVPAFVIVGLPDKAVAESRERVRAAIASLGLSLPPKRITVNLSPADLPKEGSHYDLPIALGLLGAMGVIDAESLSQYLAVGELGLDGRVAPSPGVLLAALHASERSLGLICPQAQGGEAAWAGSIEVIAAPDLLSLLNHLRGTALLPVPVPGDAEAPNRGPDLMQVKGQETAKRALEIAAAGGHNLVMVGPPGAGKSLMAACLPGILPELTAAEALEVSMVASVAGTLDGGRISRTRPFRAPHHSASMAALVGGGIRAKPGEVSLAHLGVLFLDELPEFQRAVLDSLRQPLETGNVSVARANAHVTFPARVQLVAAMNPCRCGHLGDPALACARAPRCAADYRPACGGRGRQRRGSGAAAPDRRLGRGCAAGPGCARPADRALRRTRRAHQCGGGRPGAGGGRHARRTRPQAARPGSGRDAPLRPRLHPHPARRPHDRRSGERRDGRPGARGGGAELPKAGAAQLSFRTRRKPQHRLS
jgi:magnesium chelatase family protein